jgi:hypothetical protein
MCPLLKNCSGGYKQTNNQLCDLQCTLFPFFPLFPPLTLDPDPCAEGVVCDALAEFSNQTVNNSRKCKLTNHSSYMYMHAPLENVFHANILIFIICSSASSHNMVLPCNYVFTLLSLDKMISQLCD